MDASHLLETRGFSHAINAIHPPSTPPQERNIRADPSLHVEVGNSIWSVKANERCAGVLRYDGSPNTSQYAVLRGECGKLVSMHQIGAQTGSERVYGIRCNNAPCCVHQLLVVRFLSTHPHGHRRGRAVGRPYGACPPIRIHNFPFAIRNPSVNRCYVHPNWSRNCRCRVYRGRMACLAG